jgi:Copper amine oxidase N-terminal domain
MPYTLQGQPASLSLEPRQQMGQTYVPLDEITRQLGGTTNWDNETKTATATIGQWTATVRMAETNVDVSGTAVTLAVPPFVDDGVLWVPADFFHAAFGYQVDVDAASQQVSIALPA